MTSEKSRKPSELGSGTEPRRSDLTAEKSISEVVDEDENHPWDIAAKVQYAVIFDAAGAEVLVQKLQQPPPKRQTAQITSAAEAYARD